ncbi:hypothetical protein ACN47A_09120, partial [Myxococcus fulvus]|uniref:hypothetical protein n=1 Tax=Myxococcus fulvus TaxID=33 RepID=UPI003B9C4D67
MNREFKAVTREGNVTFVGRWTGKMVRRGAASFTGRRDAQVLRHISLQLFHYVRNTLAQGSEQEVQAMLVNGRIVIAANLDASIAALFMQLNQLAADSQPSTALQELLRSVHQPDDKRSEGAAKKLGGLFAGTRTLSTMPTALTVLENDDEDLFQALDYSKERDCVAKLTGDDHDGRFILVTAGGDGIHAEQKLLLALLRSGSQSEVEIFGKKRPCVGCYLALCFARDELGLRIQFNPHPGGFWVPGAKGFIELFKQAKALARQHASADICEWIHAQATRLVTNQTQPLAADSKRSSLRDEQVSFVAKGTVDSDYTGNDSPSDSDPDEAAPKRKRPRPLQPSASPAPPAPAAGALSGLSAAGGGSSLPLLSSAPRVQQAPARAAAASSAATAAAGP